MKISIFGLGYVGCVSGACLARLGHRVYGVEPNPTKAALVNAGKSPIVEEGLDALVADTVRNGLFSATSDWESAIADSDVALVCVGTPSRPNGSIDLQFVERVCEQIGQALRHKSGYFTVVIRSTVLPGTVEEKLLPVLERHSGKQAGTDFGLCMNPEFLREGTSIHDFHQPPKTVIGQFDSRSGEALVELYKPIPGPLIRTEIRVAEMVKYVDNTFHALKIAFANEVGNLAKELGIDSHKVMDIFCQDTKLNLSPCYLKPGFAFGGSCLPKDLRAITYAARSHDLELPLLASILESNRRQVSRAATKLLEFKGRRIGFLGLSFKGGTDDLRESPIVDLVEFLIGKGFHVRISDPHVSLAKLVGANKEYIERQIPHISSLLVSSPAELLSQSEVVVVGNRGAEFKQALDASRDSKVIIDLVRVVQDPPVQDGLYYGICW